MTGSNYSIIYRDTIGLLILKSTNDIDILEDFLGLVYLTNDIII